MASIIARRAANYKKVSSVLYEGQAHLRDKFTPAPQVLFVSARINLSPQQRLGSALQTTLVISLDR